MGIKIARYANTADELGEAMREGPLTLLPIGLKHLFDDSALSFEEENVYSGCRGWNAAVRA